jgi:MoaA/NifB/PqqE/SkfB family radical SAM enzyme
MSTLVSIAPAPESSSLASHKIHNLPVLVIFPHNQCNCRCVMCDIWRIREAREISPADLDRHRSSLKQLGVRWVVFSGGEPQLNEKWSYVAQMLRSLGSRVTLLTAGLLLKPQAQAVADCVNDVIVSLDGPPAIHNSIRRIPDAFQQLAAGVAALREIRPDMQVSARCTIQKANRQSLRAVVASAQEIGLKSISFLAADLSSSAFNRPEAWLPDRAGRVSMLSEEVDELEEEMELLIREHRIDDQGPSTDRFILESPSKLRRIVQHFRAHLGQASNVAPRCNAPWVSTVIEASGDVRPCFFHPVVGNIHRQLLPDILNGPEALRFRSQLDVASNEICKRCVCSLHIPRTDGPTAAPPTA